MISLLIARMILYITENVYDFCRTIHNTELGTSTYVLIVSQTKLLIVPVGNVIHIKLWFFFYVSRKRCCPCCILLQTSCDMCSTWPPYPTSTWHFLGPGLPYLFHRYPFSRLNNAVCSKNNNLEVGQGLGQLWYSAPDTSSQAKSC